MKYKSLNLASRFPVFSGLVLGILLAEDMAIGKIFRIYAFPAGSTNLGTPLDSKNYTVQPDEATPSKPGKLQAV